MLDSPDNTPGEPADAAGTGHELDPARGQRLAQLRTDAGQTQQQLADSLGTSVETIRRWERGHTVRYSNLLSLGRHFNVDPGWIQTGADVAPLSREESAHVQRELQALGERVSGMDERIGGEFSRLADRIEQMTQVGAEILQALAELRTEQARPRRPAKRDTKRTG